MSLVTSLTLCMHLQKIADMQKLFREHEEQLERNLRKWLKNLTYPNVSFFLLFPTKNLTYPNVSFFYTVFPTFCAVCICMQDSHHGCLDGSLDDCKSATQSFRTMVLNDSVICEKCTKFGIKKFTYLCSRLCFSQDKQIMDELKSARKSGHEELRMLASEAVDMLRQGAAHVKWGFFQVCLTLFSIFPLAYRL
jgi:hypothetical protein